MSFLNGQPFTVTAEQTKLPWSGKRDGSRFRCMLCGHRFIEGDVVRFQFMKTGPNSMVCTNCDGPDVVERLNQHFLDAKQRFWYWSDTNYWIGSQI